MTRDMLVKQNTHFISAVNGPQNFMLVTLCAGFSLHSSNFIIIPIKQPFAPESRSAKHVQK